jgi:hypothetical protein
VRLPFFEDTISGCVSTLHPNSIARTRDPEGAAGSGVRRGAFDRKWRFHDEMQGSIGPDQQGKIFITAAGLGHLEDSTRVFKQRSHTEDLSATLAEISEENANHWCAPNV